MMWLLGKLQLVLVILAFKILSWGLVHLVTICYLLKRLSLLYLVVSNMREWAIRLRSLIRRTSSLRLWDEIVLTTLLLRKEHSALWLLSYLTAASILIILSNYQELILSKVCSPLSTEHTFSIQFRGLKVSGVCCRLIIREQSRRLGFEWRDVR